jgi:hypothetical protein
MNFFGKRSNQRRKAAIGTHGQFANKAGSHFLSQMWAPRNSEAAEVFSFWFLRRNLHASALGAVPIAAIANS